MFYSFLPDLNHKIDRFVIPTASLSLEETTNQDKLRKCTVSMTNAWENMAPSMFGGAEFISFEVCWHVWFLTIHVWQFTPLNNLWFSDTAQRYLTISVYQLLLTTKSFAFMEAFHQPSTLLIRYVSCQFDYSFLFSRLTILFLSIWQTDSGDW